MSSGGIVGASGMCCTQEIWNPTGKSWEGTITLRIGKEGFGSFLLERRKRRQRTPRSRDGFKVSGGRASGGAAFVWPWVTRETHCYILTVSGLVNLKLRADSAGRTISF